MKLHITAPEAAIEREKKRLEGYEDYFAKTNNPHAKEVKSIVGYTREEEGKLFKKGTDIFVQCHGDYHPKNIIIGQDRARDISTLFISVIDFDNSIFLPAAFDIGYFLSQFRYQFHSATEVLKEYSEDYFIRSYEDASDTLPKDFDKQVEIFKLRANLSIVSYLVKMGKGEGEDMAWVLKESETG
jgi:3',5'-nucleoside bisphosphate phosphatase